MLNISAASAASRIYINRKKSIWKWAYFAMMVSLLASLGFTIIMSVASYANYPSGHANSSLHNKELNRTSICVVHIDTFAAMNGISRFCEKDFPWRYSKEEHIALEELTMKNFTYLLSEHQDIPNFKCLFATSGFSRIAVQFSFPPVLLITEPKVFVHGNPKDENVEYQNWPGCSSYT
eukprot:TRINITY_DN3613_c0_g2_i2.p1 TRINITY_DN3613_c0_g2~~TRINITY_DN3613_c0_g2_i2.p1  ORF type:complete len:178 (-),score=31.52 TRINITY_DN3613_c0_g2_i2:53-586(-)